MWLETLDLMLVLLYLLGQPLQDELQERKRFVQENVIPMNDMFLLKVRDQQARRQVLYVDYLIMSRASGTVRGDPS